MLALLILSCILNERVLCVPVDEGVCCGGVRGAGGGGGLMAGI